MPADSSRVLQRASPTELPATEDHSAPVSRELVLDAVPALVSYVDAGQRYRLTNKAYADWFGQPRDYFLGRTLVEVLGDRTYQMVRPFVERALAGELVTFERKGNFLQSGVRAIRAVFIPDASEHDVIRGFSLLVTDITSQVAVQEEREQLLEREQAARAEAEMAVKALRHQRHITETIAANATACLFMVDEKGNCTFMNPAAERVTGFTFAEMIGRSLHGLTHHTRPDGTPFPQSDCPIDRALAENKPLRAHEDVFIRKDGTFFPVLCAASPIYENGSAVGTVLEVRDISEERLAREAMRRSSERLRAALHASSTGTYLCEMQTRKVFFDESLDRLFDAKPGEICRHDDVIAHIHPDDRDHVMKALIQSRDEGKDLEIEYRVIKRDGTFRWLLDKGKTVMGSDRKPVYLTGACMDITERKYMEEELMKMQKLESVGVLAGGIAHDFNNILTAILGNVALAKMNIRAGSPAYSALTEAERAFGRARDLTAQLLTFSRGGAPVKRTAAIEEVVRDTASFVLSGSSVSCDYRIASDLWPADVDVGQISQVVNNLVLNAREAMPGGGTINIAAENCTLFENQVVPLAPGHYIRLVIADQGTGISPQYLPRIFDPYFTTKQTGSGLGLATTYAIVKKHDGHIEASSAPGDGASFAVYLPASAAQVPAPVPEPDAHSFLMSGHVLVMDDEESIRQVAAALLSRLGLNVVVAREGGEALALYECALKDGRRFDVVIVDLTVPGGMGGTECMRRLRRLDPEVCAIVSSGYFNDPVMADHRSHGFAGVVAKPYELRQLSEALHAVLA